MSAAANENSSEDAGQVGSVFIGTYGHQVQPSTRLLTAAMRACNHWGDWGLRVTWYGVSTA